MEILSALRKVYHDENNTDVEGDIQAEFERRDNEEARSPTTRKAPEGDRGRSENAGQEEVHAGPGVGVNPVGICSYQALII